MLKEQIEDIKNDNSNNNEKIELEKKCSLYESTFDNLVEIIYQEEKKRGMSLIIPSIKFNLFVFL
jgi:hypothetical protein